ncbi:hypothetical protein OH76DRAFT_314261 [Lentinus brumalis]|uniref:Uncharacterized protein n=1 Tax=Lentinus brumalis TaxID=2498619 RepID=A0A371CJW3_9APHY|nr:hypothetical protein OH76DRAFT_314261 [Polyporus brumalis]
MTDSHGTVFATRQQLCRTPGSGGRLHRPARLRGPFVSATAMLTAQRTSAAAESQSSRADISRVSTRMKPRSVHPTRNPICARRITISSLRHALKCGHFNAVPSHTCHPIRTGSESLVQRKLRAGWSRLEIHHCLRTVQAHEAAALSLKARGSLVARLESSK